MEIIKHWMRKTFDEKQRVTMTSQKIYYKLYFIWTINVNLKLTSIKLIKSREIEKGCW